MSRAVTESSGSYCSFVDNTIASKLQRRGRHRRAALQLATVIPSAPPASAPDDNEREEHAREPAELRRA
jgi:hypothetical protein